MKKMFTLIELIVVIAVIGLLAAIIIPNISNIKGKATSTAVLSNIKVLQDSVDIYSLDHNGQLPVEGVTEFVPQLIDFTKLNPEQLRSLPKTKGAYYWIDAWGTVWGSYVEPPITQSTNHGKLVWQTVEGASKYKIYEIQGYQGSTNLVTGSVTTSKLKLVDEIEQVEGQETLESTKVTEGKAYIVSAIDQYGFETSPAGIGYKGEQTDGEGNPSTEEPVPTEPPIDLSITKNYFKDYSSVGGIDYLFSSSIYKTYQLMNKPVYITWQKEDNQSVKIELVTARTCQDNSCSVENTYVQFLDKDKNVLKSFSHRSATATITSAQIPEDAVMIKIYNSAGVGVINYIEGLKNPEVLYFLDEGFEYTRYDRMIKVPETMKGKNVKFNLQHGTSNFQGSGSIYHTHFAVYDDQNKLISFVPFNATGTRNEQSYTTLIPTNADHMSLTISTTDTWDYGAIGKVNSLEILN